MSGWRGLILSLLYGLILLPATSRAAVVITEIMYNPGGPDGVASPTPIGEWVEICNTGTSAVDLSGWRLDDEDATDWSPIPAGSMLAPGEVAVLCTNPIEFQQAWGPDIKTFKVTWGNLANTASATNEILVLLDANGIEVDRANYETGTNGWPATSNSDSIALTDAGADNNLGANWITSAVGVRGAYQVTAGASPYVAGDVGSPGNVANLVPIQPTGGASVAPPSTALSVQVSATGASPITVKFYGRSLRAAPAPPFRIVVLPDTQYYSQARPEIFTAQVQWILNHREDMNIAYVAHVGDIVNRAEDTYQWVNANASMSLFDAVPTLPVGMCAGNHDQYPKTDPNGTQAYNQWFPYTRYESRPWYGGHYGTDYDNNYLLFSAGGFDFIAIHLEYADPADAAVLAWAGNLLQTYANRRAIIVAHSLIGVGDPASWTSPGSDIFNALSTHANVFLMLAGHIPGEGRRTDFAANTIHTLLADYQDRLNGGDGWLRILEFVPADNLINVKSYSVTLDQYEHDADSEFSLWNPMGGATMVKLGETIAPAGDVPVSWTWPGLASGRLYQWYASLSTPTLTVNCPVQQFVTPYARPDLNQDGDINQDDMTLLLNCYTGADLAYQLPGPPAECVLMPEPDGRIRADNDKDGDVDQQDFAVLQRCLGLTTCDG